MILIRERNTTKHPTNSPKMEPAIAFCHQQSHDNEKRKKVPIKSGVFSNIEVPNQCIISKKKGLHTPKM